jgi:hypothetical protein
VQRKPPSARDRVFAVLTGDIIESSQLLPERIERARTIITEAALRFQQKEAEVVHGKPEFFRGDAWQLLLTEPHLALRVALLIRALLRAKLDVDTRISIGLGGVDNISRTPTSLWTGEAFTLSGRALDKMTGYFDMTGALPERAGVLAQWLPVTLHLCNTLVRSWTRRQAEIIGCALTLDDPTHERIARALRPRVKKQTVTDSLRGADWRALQEPITAFEETDWPSVMKSKVATAPSRR